MSLSEELKNQHIEVTRRYFLQLGAVGALAYKIHSAHADSDKSILDAATADMDYITTQDDFGTVERGDPLPYKLPLAKRLEIGLERKTWRLDVISDPDSNSDIGNPISNDTGNPFNFSNLMQLAEKHAVRFLKIMTCNNIGAPLGMGLWEGVPLRHVIWATKPKENIRRVFYYGHHNNDPKQMFRSSLPIGRVLEDPPGDNPVMLCYKLNGEWLSGKRGGPVRMLVPDAYGFKSVKWLKTVMLTNDYKANDTYAEANNDIDSWMKTMSRFYLKPAKAKVGEPIPVTGWAQVGVGGLSRVQIWVNPKDKALPEGDPYFASAPWKDVVILPPPTRWGGELPEGKLPDNVRFFDGAGRPKHWPMRYTLAHWAALLKGLSVGAYDVRCRTIDQNGIAQPMPRPFKKSGRNTIQRFSLTIES